MACDLCAEYQLAALVGTKAAMPKCWARPFRTVFIFSHRVVGEYSEALCGTSHLSDTDVGERLMAWFRERLAPVYASSLKGRASSDLETIKVYTPNYRLRMVAMSGLGEAGELTPHTLASHLLLLPELPYDPEGLRYYLTSPNYKQ